MGNVTTTAIMVRFTAEGWHCWPGAPEPRGYLADRHRHLFHVTVESSVTHDDREIEFHDLLAFCRERWPGPELGSSSCEQLGLVYLDALKARYGERAFRVDVWEDGEVGAYVATLPKETGN